MLEGRASFCAIAAALVFTSTAANAQAARGATPQGSATLIVRKILVPANDPGRFNLRIDGINQSYAAGNNGTTGAITTSTGSHSVSEVATDGTGTNLAHYTTTFGGDCSATGSVMLAQGDSKTCTITNTRRLAGPGTISNANLGVITQSPAALAELKVVKRLIPATDAGRFNLMIDGTLPGGVFGSAQGVGDNGTTGFVSVSAGGHIVSESAMGVALTEYGVSFSANCPGGHITLQPGASATCIVTNVRKHGSWTLGPGTGVVTVCAAPATCTINRFRWPADSGHSRGMGGRRWRWRREPVGLSEKRWPGRRRGRWRRLR